MSTDGTNGGNDVHDADLPPISPEDDAAVAAMLAALPDLQMPVDVAEQIATALAAEPPLSGPVPAWATGGSDTVTVLPSPQERARRSGRGLRLLTGVAAGVAVFAGLVIVGVNTGGGGDGGGATAGGAPSVTEQDGGTGAPPVGALLTTSDTAYSASDLDAKVTGLVSAASVPGVPLTTIPSSGDGPSPSASPEVSPSVRDARSLIASLFALDICLRKLDRAGDQPIAADAGTWSGQQAVVLVLDGEQVARVDAYVVAPQCGDPSDADDHMLYYATVPRGS